VNFADLSKILLTSSLKGGQSKKRGCKEIVPHRNQSGSNMEKLLKSLLAAVAPVFSAPDLKAPGISTPQNLAARAERAVMCCMRSCMRMPR